MYFFMFPHYTEMAIWFILNVLGTLYGIYKLDIWIVSITVYALIMFIFWPQFGHTAKNVNIGYYVLCLLGVIYWVIIPANLFETIILIGIPGLILMVGQK